jgi:serine/threonine-protein kinase
MDGEIDHLLDKQVGKYVMKKRIGAGGSGTVYLGEHADLKRRVAIKVLRADLVTDEESQARFEREAKVLGGLEHENIVTIIDIGYAPGIGPYMVMEWLEGITLFEARRKRKHLEFHEIIPIFDQLSSALSYMHTKKVVHRDLKPENMMLVCRPGQNQSIDDLSTRLVKLYDFGIALFTAGDDRKLTAAGMVVGTPHYMAPEQIIIDAEVDYRADLYAVGAILFELISGRPPFWEFKRPIEVMERHLRHPPPELASLLPDRTLPPGLQGVMKRAMAKNPDERFQDARDLHNALITAIRPQNQQHAPVENDFMPFSLDDVDSPTVIQKADVWSYQSSDSDTGPISLSETDLSDNASTLDNNAYSTANNHPMPLPTAAPRPLYHTPGAGTALPPSYNHNPSHPPQVSDPMAHYAAQSAATPHPQRPYNAYHQNTPAHSPHPPHQPFSPRPAHGTPQQTPLPGHAPPFAPVPPQPLPTQARGRTQSYLEPSNSDARPWPPPTPKSPPLQNVENKSTSDAKPWPPPAFASQDDLPTHRENPQRDTSPLAKSLSLSSSKSTKWLITGLIFVSLCIILLAVFYHFFMN